MKINIKIDWGVILRKVRFLFLLGMFWVLYTFAAPVFAFMWIAYFILNDLSDIETGIAEDKKERELIWKNTSMKRKDF